MAPHASVVYAWAPHASVVYAWAPHTSVVYAWAPHTSVVYACAIVLAKASQVGSILCDRHKEAQSTGSAVLSSFQGVHTRL
jgi:hypothetical protein